jgi:hypothetical protein
MQPEGRAAVRGSAPGQCGSAALAGAREREREAATHIIGVRPTPFSSAWQLPSASPTATAGCHSRIRHTHSHADRPAQGAQAAA